MGSDLEAKLEEIFAELKDLRREVGAVQKKLYSVEDAAAAWSVSPRMVTEMIRQGKVLTTAMGRRRLIHVSEIDRIAKPNAGRKPPKSPGRSKSAGYDLQAELAEARAATKRR